MAVTNGWPLWELRPGPSVAVRPADPALLRPCMSSLLPDGDNAQVGLLIGFWKVTWMPNRSDRDRNLLHGVVRWTRLPPGWRSSPSPDGGGWRWRRSPRSGSWRRRCPPGWLQSAENCRHPSKERSSINKMNFSGLQFSSSRNGGSREAAPCGPPESEVPGHELVDHRLDGGGLPVPESPVSRMLAAGLPSSRALVLSTGSASPAGSR